MAESADNPAIYWFEPEMRGIIPLDNFRVPKSVRHAIAEQRFEIKFDTSFTSVIDGCAEVGKSRPETWINEPIRRAFVELHKMGYAHSVEAWQEGKLVGGLYGLSLGGAFFGESMFSRVSEASKICLVHLVQRLQRQGYTLLDAQYRNDHLQQFGIIEISRSDYKKRLTEALKLTCEWG